MEEKKYRNIFKKKKDSLFFNNFFVYLNYQFYLTVIKDFIIILTVSKSKAKIKFNLLEKTNLFIYFVICDVELSFFFIMILIQEVATKRFNLCSPRWTLVSWK